MSTPSTPTLDEEYIAHAQHRIVVRVMQALSTVRSSVYMNDQLAVVAQQLNRPMSDTMDEPFEVALGMMIAGFAGREMFKARENVRTMHYNPGHHEETLDLLDPAWTNPVHATVLLNRDTSAAIRGYNRMYPAAAASSPLLVSPLPIESRPATPRPATPRPATPPSVKREVDGDVDDARKAAISRLLQTLVHARACCDAACVVAQCAKMKQVMLHARTCPTKPPACSVCKQFIALCCFHSKLCSDPACPVPYCASIKRRVACQQSLKSDGNAPSMAAVAADGDDEVVPSPRRRCMPVSSATLADDD